MKHPTTAVLFSPHLIAVAAVHAQANTSDI
jgi:hypothetical protein